MKVIIFTEAGGEYGYGHLTRCLAIAQGFIEKNIEVLFIIRGDENYSDLLKNITYFQIDWFDIINIEKYFGNDNIAIVDSYYSGIELNKIIIKKFKSVIFIDDYNRISYPGGFVLNGVIGAENIDYPINNCVKYLLGTKYQPLRKEFWEIKEYNVRSEIKVILLSFGGSDPFNKTPEYLKKVNNKYMKTKKKVIIGNGFNNVEEIKQCKDDNTELIGNPDASKMAKIMLKSDLAIVAAGQTISELARIGVPTIAVKVADNQENNIKYWKKCGFLLGVNEIPNDISFNKRKMASKNGKKAIDGNGVKRILKVLNEY